MRMDIGRTYTTQYRREEKAGKKMCNLLLTYSVVDRGHFAPNGRLKQTEQTFLANTNGFRIYSAIKPHLGSNTVVFAFRFYRIRIVWSPLSVQRCAIRSQKCAPLLPLLSTTCIPPWESKFSTKSSRIYLID